MNKTKTMWEWGYGDRAVTYNIITVVLMLLSLLIYAAVIGWEFAMTVTC